MPFKNTTWIIWHDIFALWQIIRRNWNCIVLFYQFYRIHDNALLYMYPYMYSLHLCSFFLFHILREYKKDRIHFKKQVISSSLLYFVEAWKQRKESRMVFITIIIITVAISIWSLDWRVKWNRRDAHYLDVWMEWILSVGDINKREFLHIKF